MTNSGIYVIENQEDGTVYIGSTRNFKRRWRRHCNDLRKSSHSNPHLLHAWNLYGESAFEFGVLEYLDDPEELHLAEQWWMDLYREEGHGLYNMGLCARHPWLGRELSNGHKQRISRALMGHGVSEETRRKLSRALSGEGHPNYGKHLPEETRRKIGRAHEGNQYGLGHKHTIEARQKMSRAMKSNQNALGHTCSDETRRKISEAQKTRWTREKSEA